MLPTVAVTAACASLFGWSLLLSWRVERPLGATLLPAFAGALLVANFGLVYGIAVAAHIAVVGGGLLALGFSLAVAPRASILRLTAPAPLLVILGGLAIGIANAPALFVEWDEFSHWGKVAKFIALAGTYPTPETYAGFLDYPFGLAAFQSLFLWPGTFSEPATMTAHALFALACFAAVLERTGWRDWPIVIALAALMIAARYFFHPHPWSSILPDTLIGLSAAGAGAIYWRGDGDWRGILLAAPILAALPFLKDVGQFLAVMLLAFMALDQLMRFATGRSVREEIGTLAVALLVLLVAKALWANHIEAIGAATTFARSPEHLIGRLMAPGFGADSALVVQAFLDNLAATPVVHRRAPDLPVWLGVIGLVALAAALLARARQAAARIVLANLVFALGIAAYAGGLLALYLFSFSAYEGVRAASFARYIGTFVAFWATINLAFLADPPYRNTVRRIAVFVVIAVLFVLTVRDAGNIVRRDVISYAAGNPGGGAVPDLRRTVRERLANAPDGSLHLVWTGTKGGEYFIGALELAPRSVAMPGCFSPGPERFEGDIWSCDLSPEAFSGIVATRDHLALGHTDDVFWERYGRLFVDGAQQSDAVWFKAGDDGRLAPVR